MLELTVNLNERSYPIFVGEHFATQKGELLPYLGKNRPVIVTNQFLHDIYLHTLTTQLCTLEPLVFILPDGEQYKTLEWFEKLTAFLLQHNCGRDTCLIAFGGGVVGDLTGFVAACYQRGVPFIQIPTTLLAQVDSSVGGKTAVNHPLGKNMIGAFYQPQAVFINTHVLNSLPAREFAAGMAEVIKYGLICDADFITLLEQQHQQINALSPKHLQHIIYHCCKIKADIVTQDETEKGQRALLNLGHTFGHAIEAHMGYGTYLHGEAVAIGMVLAARLAALRNWLNALQVQRIINLLNMYQLPTEPPQQMTSEHFIAQMRKDKKNQQGKIRFILPTRFGQCALIDDVTEGELQSLLDH